MPDYGPIHPTHSPFFLSSTEGSSVSSNSIKSKVEAPSNSEAPSVSPAIEKAFQTLVLQDKKSLIKDSSNGYVDIFHYKMTENMPLLPDLTVESFDGTTSGARFLMALKLNLRTINLDTWPGLCILAVYIKVKGEAAVWMDTTPHIAALVETFEK